MAQARFQDVAVRDLTESDVPLVLDYWFRSPPGFIEAMGVDLGKFPSEDMMRMNLIEKCQGNARLEESRLNALVIEYQGESIGVHTLFPYEETKSGVFHAHLFKPEMRGLGIAEHSYPQACRVFMDRFRLEKILFKTPIQNRGAIRVKEKLGIRTVGEEIIDFGIIRAGTRAQVFELLPNELNALLSQRSGQVS